MQCAIHFPYLGIREDLQHYASITFSFGPPCLIGAFQQAQFLLVSQQDAISRTDVN